MNFFVFSMKKVFMEFGYILAEMKTKVCMSMSLEMLQI